MKSNIKAIWNRILKQYEILSISHVFWYSIDDIFRSSGWILMQDSVLETSLVVDSNFIVKFGSKAEISWKLEELNWNFLNNSEVSSYFDGFFLSCRISGEWFWNLFLMPMS